MTENLGQMLLDTPELMSDFLQALSLLLGKSVDSNDLDTSLKEVKEAWRRNNMNDVIALSRQMGIITDKDMANFVWVKTNWSKKQDDAKRAKRRRD